jgi:FtsP/CotA-like multicopper oxidase with cupredoxin domain
LQAPNELVHLPICSAYKAVSDALKGICKVTTLPSGRNRVQVNLAARTEKIEVGGYGVVTENYNGSYLSPVAEAIPGDTVAARLENQLRPREPSDGHSHGPAAENPTNLHYFHGGIVTPNNARPPDGRVLEQTGVIPHPNGLNWYHSHLHGRSSDQVMGGLSGLLSVGDAKANVVACKPNPADPTKCLNDVDANTELKARTDVRYALLRDIALKNITALPIAAGDKSADWAPEDKDWKQKLGERARFGRVPAARH